MEDRSKQWMGIGKSYVNKLFDELDPEEKKMDFDWKNSVLESYALEELETDTFYQDYLFKDLVEQDLDYKVILRHYYEENKCDVKKIDIMDINEYLGFNNVAVSPCLYFENYPKRQLLNKVCAFVLDIDKLRPKDLKRFFSLFDENRVLKPTVIVNSGSGVHFYYILDKFFDVDSVDNSQNKELAEMVYNRLYAIIRDEEKYMDAQKHWIGQDYRVVGSRTKLYQIASAWKLKDDFYSIDELINYCNVSLGEKKRIATKSMIKYAKSIANTLKIDYPDFEDFENTYKFIALHKDDDYQVRQKKKEERRLKESLGNGKKKKSSSNLGWYRSTYEIVLEKTVAGNRFNALKALAIIAYKEKKTVSREVFMSDLELLVDKWNKKDWKGDKFNSANVSAIMRLYDNAEKYEDTTSEKLEEWLGWDFRRGLVKRNGRNRVDHLKRARAVQMVDYPEREWINKNGRPKGSGTAEQKVKQWQLSNPNGKKVDCHRATGLDPKTIRKWWK